MVSTFAKNYFKRKSSFIFTFLVTFMPTALEISIPKSSAFMVKFETNSSPSVVVLIFAAIAKRLGIFCNHKLFLCFFQ